MKNQRKKGIILSYVLIFINTIIAIAYTPFVTKMLGQSEYGLYSLVNSIVGYLTILDLGFGNAIIVYTSKYNEKQSKNELNKLYGMFRFIYGIIAIIAVLLGMVLFLSADLLFANTMTTTELNKAKIMLLILTFNLSLNFVFTIYSSIITANEKFVFQKTVAIVRTILNPIIMIPLLLAGFKSITMIIIVTMLNIIVLVSNYFYCIKKLNIRIKYQGIDKKILKEICFYSLFVFLNVIVDKINWNLDQFIIGSVVGTKEVAIYAVASQFNSMYLSFAAAINNVLLPKIAKMIEKKCTNDEITEEFVKTSRIHYFVLFLLMTGFIIFGKKFIILFFGKDYVMSYYTALLLMVPITIHLTQGTGLAIIQAKNLHKFRSIMLIIISALNLVISISLAKSYGSVGAAIGTGISLIVGDTIIMNIYYQKKVGITIKKYWKNFIVMTAKLSIPVAIILLILHYIVRITNIINLFVFAFIYVLIYCSYCYLFVMNNYEKNLILSPLKKFYKKLNN